MMGLPNGRSGSAGESSVVIPLSPQVDPTKKDKTPKVSCVQGLGIFACLATAYFSLVATVIYVGFLTNLYRQDALTVLITTGADSHGEPIRNSTYIDLSNIPLAKTCSKPPYFPKALMGAIGTVLSKKLRLCGGHGSSDAAFQTCYTYERDHWEEKLPMYVPRSYAAGVHMPGYGWLVSGGENPKDGLLDTSELQDKATNEFEISVVLPVKVSRHCVVKMNATQIMLIGGTTEAEEASHQTYVMNWEGNRRWTPAANLHTGRHSHVCFLYDHRILVAGGKVLGGNSFGTDSVESYNFARGVWTTFTSLPGPIAGGAYFPWQGYPTVLGGSPNQAMFQCQKDKWFKLEEHLPYKVHYPVLILTKVSRLCPELGSGKD